MVATPERDPRVLFSGGPDENVEDLIEEFLHVLGSKKLRHVTEFANSPFLEQEPEAPDIVRAPKAPAGMTAHALFLESSDIPVTPKKSDSAKKGSKSHEKRARKKARESEGKADEAAASPETSSRAADNNRAVAYTVQKSIYDHYLVEQKEHELLVKDLEQRRKKWRRDTCEAVSLLYLRVGKLVKPCLRGCGDSLQTAYTKLRDQFHVANKVTSIRKIIGFLQLEFPSGRTAEQWNMMFNEHTRKFSRPPDKGGVGETISVDTLATAVFVMSLMAQPSTENFVTSVVTEGMEASLRDTQVRFVNSRALIPGPIGKPPPKGAPDPVNAFNGFKSRGKIVEQIKVVEKGEIAFETNEPEASADDESRCSNCKKIGHKASMCYIEGGGRWKESRKYARQQREQQEKQDSKSKNDKSKFRKEVAKEVARQMREQQGSESDSESAPTRKSRRKRPRKKKKPKSKSSYSGDTSSTDEFQFMVTEPKAATPEQFAFECTEVPKLTKTVPKYIDFHVDSACSSHMVPATVHSKVSVQGVRTQGLSVFTAGANGQLETTTRAAIPGSVLTTRGTRMDALLTEALGVKMLNSCLFSVFKAVQQGHTIIFKPKHLGGSYLQLKGRSEKIRIEIKGKAFVLRLFTEAGRRKQCRRKQKKQNRLLHRQCGHWNHKALSAMKAEGLIADFDYDVKLPRCKCRICELSKSTKASFPKVARSRAVECGVGTHWDIKGPTSNESLQGSTFVAIATDDKSRHRKVYHMSSTANLHKYVKSYHDGLRRRGFKASWMRWDNQFDTKAMQALADDLSFEIQDSAAYCQSQDGVSEAAVNTWSRGVRSMLKDQRRSADHWEYASSMFTYIWNRMKTSASPEATPHEQWYGVQPSAKNFAVALSDVTFHRYKDERKQDGTFEDRATAGILVGYAPDQLSYIVLAEGTEYKRRFEDVTPDQRSKLSKAEKLRRRKHYYDSDSEDTDDGYESSSSSSSEDSEDSPDSEGQDSAGEEVQGSPPAKVTQQAPATQNVENQKSNDDEIPTKVFKTTKTHVKWGAARIAKHVGCKFEDLQEWNPEHKFHEKTQFRLGTELTVPIRKITAASFPTPSKDVLEVTGSQFAYVCRERSGGPSFQASRESVQETSFLTQSGEYAFNMQLSSIVRPKNYRAAHRENPHSAHWAAAEAAELKALEGKFEESKIEDVLNAGKIIGHGMWQYAVKPDKLKARWVYDGSTQDSSDLGNIAAEVLRYVTCRMILINAVHHGHVIRTLDVSNAFLHRRAEEPFYMHHPPGQGKKGTCMKWNFLLYGRREAPMGWRTEAHEFVVSQGFEQCKVDSSKYVKRGATPSHDMIIGIFVDDLIMCGPEEAISVFEKATCDKYPTKLLGDIDTYLGMQVKIDRQNKTVLIHQPQAIEKFLKFMDMRSCKTRTTPMDMNAKFFKCKGECTDKELQSTYRSIVGSLMHFSTVCRPDIAFATICLSRQQNNPTPEHLQYALQVVRYLRGTSELGLLYHCAEDPSSTFYCAADSDWAGTEECVSTTANVAFVCGAAISWLCCTQRNVTHSSCESEYVSLDSMCREVEHLRMLFDSFNMPLTTPTVILEDNQSAIALAASSVCHRRSKHIALRFHYIRQLIRDGVVVIQYHPTSWQPADLLTKNLGRVLFARHAQVVMGHAKLQGTTK